MNDIYDYISVNETNLVQAINESFESFGKVIKIETIKKEPLSKRKKFYKILFTNNKWAHLTIAQNLTSQYDKTKRFNELFPDISCKTLFIIKFSNFDVLGQEYFDGFSIDHLITNSLITQKEVFCIYNKIYHSYNYTNL